jgi:hypothetical protein
MTMELVNKDDVRTVNKNNKYRGLPGNEDYNEKRRIRYQENREHIKNQILEARYIRGY